MDLYVYKSGDEGKDRIIDEAIFHIKLKQKKIISHEKGSKLYEMGADEKLWSRRIKEVRTRTYQPYGDRKRIIGVMRNGMNKTLFQFEINEEQINERWGFTFEQIFR